MPSTEARRHECRFDENGAQRRERMPYSEVSGVHKVRGEAEGNLPMEQSPTGTATGNAAAKPTRLVRRMRMLRLRRARGHATVSLPTYPRVTTAAG